MNASPITDEQNDYDRAPTSISDPLYEFYEQTKNLGQQAMDRISDTALSIGTTVGDFASELFQQGSQHTAGFFSSGHEIVLDNFEQVKRFGEAGLNLLKKAVSDTGSFFSDSIPKFPFIELNIIDRRDTNLDSTNSDSAALNCNTAESKNV